MPNDNRPFWLALALLFLLVVSNLPLFLCMPPIDDAVLWDLHTREYLRGGVPYRDVLETNPPAMLWVLGVARRLAGDSSVALRTTDLVMFCLVVFLALAWLRDAGISRAGRAWSALLCGLWYFSLSEWCHCQRDMWLLAPSLAVVWLRGRQIKRVTSGTGNDGTEDHPKCGEPHEIGSHFRPKPGSWFRYAVLEGLVLGAGMWLKPMILVPAATAWLVGLCWTRRWRFVLVDALGLGVGLTIAGASGVAWLGATGAWPYFVDTFLSWNPGYVAAGRQHWTGLRFLGTLVRLSPWYLLHIPAVGYATIWLGRTLARREASQIDGDPSPYFPAVPLARLSGFYAGWLVQAFFLQHLFDYTQAPGILLALLVVAAAVGRTFAASGAIRVAAIAFVGLALLLSPTIRGYRLACWWSCVTQGSTPAVRDRLRLLSMPEWQDLDRVVGHLRQQQIADGQLMAFNNSLIHLYWELGIRPPTRYVYFENCLVFFPERTEQIMSTVAAARPRYVVSDLIAAGLSPEALDSIRPGTRLRSVDVQRAGAEPLFPWSHPVVFRAGRYAVHRVEEPLGEPALTVGGESRR